MDSVSALKAECFVGIARVDLDLLSFEYALQGRKHRGESKKAVARLLSVFELEGCHRLEESNFVEAVINRACLTAALAQVGLTEQKFQAQSYTQPRTVEDVVQLYPNKAIQCLHGLQRILAARKFLDNNDRWWVVKLYREEDCLIDLRTHVYESFAHEQCYTDGTIFRNIRFYSRMGNKVEEDKWWARLSETKKRDLRHLISSSKYNDRSVDQVDYKEKKLIDSFDELLDLRGLWPPIQLGTLHRLHGLRCREELMSYLLHVKNVWKSIVMERYQEHVDEITVSELELLAPAVSSRDRRHVESLMKDRKIFVTVVEERSRAELLRNILSQTHLIPSLRTFFEDQKYLEPCSTILRSLLDDSEKRTLWSAFRANYWAPSKVQLQYSEGTCALVDVQLPLYSDKDLGSKFGFLQLWLFCARHFPETTSIKPRIQSRKSKRIMREYSFSRLQQLGCLAVRLGFRTQKALNLALEAADWTEDVYEKMQQPISMLTENPSFTSNGYWPRERRTGRPYDEDHDNDQEALFPLLFYHRIKPGYDITPLFVKRNMFQAFLGPFIPPVQQDMQDLLKLLITQQAVPPKEQVQRDVQQLRENELARLRAELAATLKKVETCEALATQQYILFQTEITNKTDRIVELEQQLNTRNGDETELHDLRTKHIHTMQHIKNLEDQTSQLKLDNLAQAEHILQLKDLHLAETQKNEYLEQQFKNCDEEREYLQEQIDSADILGHNYDNSSLGAPPCQDWQTDTHELRTALEEKDCALEILQATVKTNDVALEKLKADIRTRDADLEILQATVKTNDVALEKLKADIQTRDADLEILRNGIEAKEADLVTLRSDAEKNSTAGFEEAISFQQTRRHKTLSYSMFSDLDIKKLYEDDDKRQWRLDMITITNDVIEVPKDLIQVTVLDADNGVRSVKVNVRKANLIDVERLLTCLRKYDMDYGLHLIMPGDTGEAIVSRVLTHADTDAKSFAEVMYENRDARVFFAQSDVFSHFLESYKDAVAQDKAKLGIKIRKRRGNLLQGIGKRSALWDLREPEEGMEDEEL